MTDHGRHSRGLVLLTVGNGVYIVSGYAITVWLAHHLGPARFGAYGVVIAVVTIVNILVTRGVPVAAQRRVAAGEGGTAGETMRAATRALAVPALAVGALLAVLAVPLASAFGDDRLRAPLAIGAIAAVTYAAQGLALAVPTALHEYRRQALAQVAYAIGRLALIVGGAIGGGLDGAIAGFVAAPLVGAVVAALRLRATAPDVRDKSISVRGAAARAVSAGRAGVSPEVTVPDNRSAGAVRRDLLRAAVPLVATASFVTLLLSADLLGVQVAGGAHDAGLYAAAGTIAHVPFFLLQSAALVLLPGVATSAGVEARVALVRRGLTDTLVLLTFATIQVALLGTAIAQSLFGSRFADAGTLVAPLALATWGITVHAACVAIDGGLARLRATMVLGATACAAVFGAAWWARSAGTLGDAAGAVAAVCLVVGIVHLGIIGRRAELRGAGALVTTRSVVGLGLLNVPFTAIAVVAVIAHDQTGAVWPLVAAGGISGVAYLWSASRLGLLGLGRFPRADRSEPATN